MKSVGLRRDRIEEQNSVRENNHRDYLERMRKRENQEKEEMKKMEPTYEEIGEGSELELLGEKVPEQKVQKMAPNLLIRRMLRMNEQKMSKQKILNKDVEMKDQEVKEGA